MFVLSVPLCRSTALVKFFEYSTGCVVAKCVSESGRIMIHGVKVSISVCDVSVV